ncbi:MAG: translocation/assembly module TamB domain-containing protein [Spirosomataceae bacterium]
MAFNSGDLDLHVSQLNTQLNDFRFSPNLTSGEVASASFIEKRGFVLRQLHTDILYSNTQTSLQKLFLQTNETTLRDRAVLRYASLEEFSKNIGNVGVDLNLKNSQLGFKDVLAWLPSLRQTPPFKKNPTAIVQLNGAVTGKINNLLLKAIEVSTLQATRLKMEGRITGLPDINKMNLNLNISELSSSKPDLARILPDKTIPGSITIPNNLTLSGTLQGRLDNLSLDTKLTTNLGNATFAGNLKNFVKATKQGYDGTLTLTDLDAGKILQQSPQQLGKITLAATITGQGIDPKTMQAELTSTIESADLNGYLYRNLDLTGTLNQQIAHFTATSKDPNASLNLVAKADLRGEYPVLSSEIDIASLRLKPLHFYGEDIGIQGRIEADFSSTDPENPRGTVVIHEGILTQEGKSIPLGNVSLLLDNQNGERLASIDAPFLKARATGVFRYVQLADIVLTELNRYFALPDLPYTPIATPYRFQIEGKLSNHPTLKPFVPELTRLDTVRFTLQLDSQRDTSLLAKIAAPLIEYDSILVNQVDFNVLGANNQAMYNSKVGQVLYDTYQIKRAFLEGKVVNNVVDFDMVLKDSVGQPRHGLVGSILAIGEDYRLQLRNKGLLLDYKSWQADSTGYVQFGEKGLLVNDFSLFQSNQRLFVNSLTPTPNSPIRVQMDSIRLNPIVAMTGDSLQMSGVLGGNIILQNYVESPVFTGDIAIQSFTYTNIPIGDLAIKATNESAAKIVAEATLKSPQNEVRLNGDYLFKTKKPLDLKLDISRLSAQTIEAFSVGQLRRARGFLTGNATIKGALNEPQIEGKVAFDSVAFNVTQLGSTYRINKSLLTLKNSEVLLQKFIITDTLNQPLQVDGKIDIAKLSYNLTVLGNNFTVLNASRKDNDFFYGKGVVDANLHIEGVGARPVIDGSVKLKEGSDITVILPDDNLGTAETEGVVEFINRKNPNATPKDSTETTPLDFASEISLNLEADDRSQFTIVVDELNGDNLKVKGNAQLNAGISPNGQPYILGLYELTQGSYDLTIEVLKRGFTIQKGSRLLWTGDPMKADVDITAIYPITADLSALKATSKNYGKIPLFVLLKMQGSLSNPQISFDVKMDDKQLSAAQVSEIEDLGILKDLRENPVQMNKQVFSLLIFNKFIGEQSSDFFSSVNPEVIARQSVSKLLTATS